MSRVLGLLCGCQGVDGSHGGPTHESARSHTHSSTHKLVHHNDSALGSAAAAAGLVANGGARYAKGGAFFPESLTTGLIPTAVMALLGAFVYTAFSDAVAAKALAAAGSGKKRGWGATPPPAVVAGIEEWMYV